MKLYFLRHGRADRSQWRGGDDFDRPLTKDGKNRIARTADVIADLNLGLDIIVTSPLVRAFQTAEIVAKNLGMTERLVTDERLGPGFHIENLSDILLEQPQAASILLVGHEPDFSTMISDLIGGGRVVCKKGSLARVDLNSSAVLSGQLVWLMPPKAFVV